MGCLILAATLAAVFAPAATAQSREFSLDEEGGWVQETAPEPGTDAAVMAEASRLLAEDRPAEALRVVNQWLNAERRTNHPLAPRAYLLRGDARVAMGNEFDALFDYEREVIRRFPESDEFAIAIERELEIAVRYAHGLQRKFLGMRIIDAGDIAEEAFIRVQERLPGSALAERAAIELADYYYRKNDLELAVVAYDLYLENFPDGPNRARAMEGRIRANIERFPGPEYDASSLIDAREQIREFAAVYPTRAQERGFDQELLERLNASEAAQMLDAARWYIARGDLPSARFKLRRLLQRRPDTPAADEALAMMGRYGWVVREDSASPASGDDDPSQESSP